MRYVPAKETETERRARDCSGLETCAVSVGVGVILATVILMLRGLGLPAWALTVVGYLLSLAAVKLLCFLRVSFDSPFTRAILGPLWGLGCALVFKALRKYGLELGWTDIISSALSLFVVMLLGWLWLSCAQRLGMPKVWGKEEEDLWTSIRKSC